VSRMQRARTWWTQRNARERSMLALMLAAIAAFALWYGMLSPTRAVREAAQQRYDLALDDLRTVQASVDTLQGMGPTRPQQAQALATAIEARAVESGVALSRQRRDSAGQLVVELDGVTAPVLFAWLQALQSGDGIEASSVRAERAGARLRAEVTFVTAP